MIMKQIFLIGLAFAFFTACQPIDDSESPLESSYSGEYSVKHFEIDGHSYVAVYATCDGRPGHTVKKCQNNHYSLFHSPSCSCRDGEESVDAEEPSNNGNDW